MIPSHPRNGKPAQLLKQNSPQATLSNALAPLSTQAHAACVIPLVVALTLVALAALASPAACMGVSGGWSRIGKGAAALTPQDLNASTQEMPRTLVMYAWNSADEISRDNLAFFVKHGMHGCSACEYVVIMHEDTGHSVRTISGPPARVL